MPGILPPGQAPPKTTGQGNPPDVFVAELAQATGLDQNVIRAWVRIEGAYAPGGTGGYNFLNLRPAKGGRSYSGVALAGVSSGNFQQFRSVDDAVKETAHWINTFGNYGGIRQSTHLGPRSQLAAIAASPWDAGHYGGGRSLYDSYNAVIKSGGGILHTIGGVVGGIGKAGVDTATGNIFAIPGDFGGIPGVKSIPGVSSAISAAEAPARIAESIGSVISFAFNPENWLRIGFIIGGGVLVLGGTVLLAKSVGALNVQGGGAPSLLLPEAKALDLRSQPEKQYASRSYGSSREGTGKPETKSFDLGLPNQGGRRGTGSRRRSPSRGGTSEAIPF